LWAEHSQKNIAEMLVVSRKNPLDDLAMNVGQPAVDAL